jgi:hypothetical protein
VSVELLRSPVFMSGSDEFPELVALVCNITPESSRKINICVYDDSGGAIFFLYVKTRSTTLILFGILFTLHVWGFAFVH